MPKEVGMFEKIRGFFTKTWVNGAAVTRKDEFVQMVAVALMESDGVKDYGMLDRYYTDALFVIRHVQGQIGEATSVAEIKRAARGRRGS